MIYLYSIIEGFFFTDFFSHSQNGKDFDTALKETHIKIYQSVNPSFNPDEQFSIDTCYRDIPTVDMAMFTVARKLLNDAQSIYIQKQQ